MKITILWSGLASYSVAFFKELSLQGCSIQLIFQPIDADALYQPFDLSFCQMILEDSIDVRMNIESLVRDFNPACILMSSWCFPHYMHLTKKLRRNSIYVVSAMDNQWRGTIRQYFGVVSSSIFLKPSIDTFLVSGDRQALFANKLGYQDLMYGYGAADIKRFICDIPIGQRHENFLFIGRLIKIKGITELARAYMNYREQMKEPWGLKVSGSGPLMELLKGMPGVDLLGFVQPANVPKLMSQARCFILPSRWEQWGVVLHEATAAGLPVIATYPCGSTTMFARDGVNGYVVPPKSQHLTKAMVRVSTASQTVLERMSIASSTLAKLWDPAKLAENFLSNINDCIGRTSSKR